MKQMDNRPIGMFDSGVGGLTVYKEVKKQLPNESIVYLGDTKRFPYGSKSKESIIELTKQGIDFLIRQNVKLIVIACGTATSQALEEVKNLYSVPIIGIIDSTVEYLEEKYRNNKNAEIGIIATTGTIKSNGWQNKIKELIPSAKIKAKGCPLLAPMAEEGWTDNQIARLTIKEYLIEMKKIDTLILGCTHYPLFQKIIKKEMGKRVEIINTGEKIARKLTTYLQENNIQNVEEMIEDKIYLTDTECNFVSVAEKLLGDNKIGEKIQKAEYLQITT
jgi:glutamate racemase